MHTLHTTNVYDAVLWDEPHDMKIELLPFYGTSSDPKWMLKVKTPDGTIGEWPSFDDEKPTTQDIPYMTERAIEDWHRMNDMTNEGIMKIGETYGKPPMPKPKNETADIWGF